MPTNISGRVTLILTVLFLALWAIFPSGNIFKPNLKPGIDMVGGTSLLYEIKVPPGGFQGNLAETVMNLLKKRVDPQGVRNLIWRPQGNTRLEIQMPTNAQSKDSAAIKKAFEEAQKKLEDTNVRPGEVLYAVQETTGEQRVQRLKELAQGSQTRAEILSAMASTWDQMKTAEQQKNAAEQARLQLQYEKLQDRLADTNLPVSDFQGILDLNKPDAREQQIQALQKRFADFPARLAAMTEFENQYAQYSKVKGVIDDAGELKRLLRGSGVIEFHIVANDLPPATVQEMTERLLRRGPRPQAGDEVRWYPMDRSEAVIDQVDHAIQSLRAAKTEAERLSIIKSVAAGSESVENMMRSLAQNLNNPEIVKARKNQVEDALLLGGQNLVDYAGKKWVLAYITPDKSLMRRPGQAEWHLAKAQATMESGEREVGFEFDPQGAKLFGDLTGSNIGKPLGIVLDDKMISAPNINSQITSRGVITGGGRGGFSESEMNYLVNTLNAGALPAQLADEPISEETIGPALGADNLRAGLYSSIIGLLVVAIFMIVYYHISGIIAVLALLMNMIMILGVMAMLNATWTLPAIAGIVLTIGMSVDANVLVFERLREEQARGLSLKMAMRNAYDRAASAIIDSNAVTAITCVILYYFGSEEVKGFGLTLLIGLISSLFTALFVTKTIFAGMMNNFNLHKLGSLPTTVPAFGKLLHPNVHWMSKSKYFLAASILILVAGTISLVVTFHRGQLFDIEFSSGTAVQFELKTPTSQADVRQIVSTVSEADIPSPSVVAVGTDQLTYLLSTPAHDQKKVTDAILTAFSGKLNLQQPSNFEGMDLPLDQALNKTVYPIGQDTRTIDGYAPASLRAHIGGVAVLLKKLDPPLSAKEIDDRLSQAKLQPVADASKPEQYRPTQVETFPDGTAVILSSDPDAPYDASDPLKIEQWTQELAAPIWTLVRDAVHNPPKLQRVTNFNPQVAGEMQRDALVALTLSLLVVMAYIWLRFGNMKYGTATVVAMLHDTLLVIGAIGLSHFIGNTSFGKHVLLIEPFRVNLTLVAAVLTVMSYSMVDTIVVFDRIRENRGKYGHLDEQIINDSVNQTLSRTLLTAGTTVMTVFVMYLFGGPGIHGFTFVMLIGILVGTYSSIAIAAPILLIGERRTQQASGNKAVGQKQLQGA